jgi:hypothetical protein
MIYGEVLANTNRANISCFLAAANGNVEKVPDAPVLRGKTAEKPNMSNSVHMYLLIFHIQCVF